ncbi:MAG: hypothetical protein U0168_04845 [Nannocystaceae bacterium]
MNSTTAAPSRMGPTGPWPSSITKASRYWSSTPSSAYMVSTAARALAEASRVAVHVAGQPRDHGPVGLVAVMVTRMRPRRWRCVRRSPGARRLASRRVEVTQAEQASTSRPSSSTCARGRDALGCGAAQQREQVIDVAVDVAVQEQAQQVQRLAGAPHVRDGVAPARAFEQRTRGDSVAHELGTLIEDAPGPERIVADLAVAHVRVAGHADRAAVGQQRAIRRQLPRPTASRREQLQPRRRGRPCRRRCRP